MESKTKKEKTGLIFKKTLCFFMTVLMLISSFGGTLSVFATERTVVDSGECGAWGYDVTYTLYNDGELVISGEGDMHNYFEETSPFSRPDVKNIIIKEGVTNIGGWSILDCENLTSVTIPNSITDVCSYAFYGCDMLTDVHYSGTEEQWNEIAIEDGNTALTNANIHFNWVGNGNVTDGDVTDDNVSDGNVTDRTVIDSGSCGDNVTYTLYDDGELLISGEGDMWDYTDCETPFDKNRNNIKSIVFSDGVTSVGGEAFNNFDSLENIKFSDTMELIGYSAFDHCDDLATITIPDSVTEIENYAFEYCDRLTSVTIGDGITRIGYGAFAFCHSLTSVTIGDSVTIIESEAFVFCDSLTDVYYRGTEEQWNEISIADYNTALTNADIHFNSAGNGNVTDGDVSDDNVTDGNVSDGNVTDDNITDGNVTDGNITDKYITLVRVKPWVLPKMKEIIVLFPKNQAYILCHLNRMAIHIADFMI